MCCIGYGQYVVSNDLKADPILRPDKISDPGQCAPLAVDKQTSVSDNQVPVKDLSNYQGMALDIFEWMNKLRTDPDNTRASLS